jgi:hypothetical protein
MRARNRTVLHQSLPASAPGGEASSSSAVSGGWLLRSGAMFETAVIKFGKEAWTMEDDQRLKAAERASKQALFAEAFEKTTMESVCWPMLLCHEFSFTPSCSNFDHPPIISPFQALPSNPLWSSTHTIQDYLAVFNHLSHPSLISPANRTKFSFSFIHIC